MNRDEYAALLDFDGTLVDSIHIYYTAVNKILSRFGVSCTYEEMYARAGESGEELYTHFLKKHGKYDHAMEKELATAFYKEAYGMVSEVSFPRDSADTIKSLHDEGYAVAICTGATRGFVEAIIPDSVMSSIDSIVTCDDVLFGKPHPETFLRAADEIRIHPFNCVVVGDSKNDLVGADKAGMGFILMRNKYNAHIKEGYDREITNIAELFE